MGDKTPSRPTRRAYYAEDVDFDALARENEEFAVVWKGNDRRLDWHDPRALQSLTKALLRTDFGIVLSLPGDRLCPPVPVRWNYVRWIQDLLDTTSESLSDRYDPQREVTGLDIGVGASCIYPLLACASRPQWRMLGTDIDEHSLNYAQQNIKANNLPQRIRLKKTVAADSPLIPLDSAGCLEAIDFVMCNPPFYTSEDDMRDALDAKISPPSAVCTGSPSEMITPGGDVGFAMRILNESLALRERVQWYSCMLGKLASVHQLVAKLKDHGISNFAVTNMTAGQKTRRWAVAWSFADWRPGNEVARHGELVLAILPPTTDWTISVAGASAQGLGKHINELMGALDLRWQFKASIATGVGIAKKNVWSRAARRKKKFKGENDMPETRESEAETDGEPVALAVRLQCGDGKVDLRWLRGSSALVFESFCGMMKRSLGVRCR